MKKQLPILQMIGLVTAYLVSLSSFQVLDPMRDMSSSISALDEKLKKASFKILDTKCNICHRKKNPFMVFNEKNMTKRAKKIYRMVFVERKMPKGNEVRLTNEEYVTLEKWLFTQDIF